MNNAEELYNRLKECYLSSQSTNTDKAKRFRSIYEEFAEKECAQAGNNISLGIRLAVLFNQKNASESLSEKSKNLVIELNTVVHTDKSVSNEQLQKYYKELVLIIQELSNVTPDEKTKTLCGIQKTWYAEGLNTEQRNAVLDDADVINVNAGPGTGKTHLLVHKMLYYLQDDPNKAVVALSFTNAAATELQKKFYKIQAEIDRPDITYQNCLISTIHSFCFTLLSSYYEESNIPFDFEILDESDIPAVAEEIALQCGLTTEKDKIEAILTKGGVGPLAEMVEDYKKKHRFIRVDEILDIFINGCKSDCFKRWLVGKVDCLLVDESQDLTIKIYHVISLLSSINPSTKMFFVGDPRQNIFGFNGGSYKNFRAFIEKRHVSEHTLSITYRCPQAIIDKVNPLQFDDCPNPHLELKDKSLLGLCKIYSAYDRKNEAQQIVNIIQSINNNENTSVICTGLWYLQDTAMLLNQNNIPFVVMGGKRYITKSIKILNYCLRMVSMPESNSEERLSNVFRNFHDSPLRLFLNQKKEELKNKKNIVVHDIVNDLADFLINGEYISNDQSDLYSKYIEKSKEYNAIVDLLFACSIRKNDEFTDFYERDFKVKCDTEITVKNRAVTLTTIHSAKGLEWDNVILAGASENVLPSYRCFEKNISAEEIKSRINEEKKKYYVAVTRSKKNLYITYSLTSKNQYGKIFNYTISQFVKSS
ncbi:MAG: ATP-dependent helicase [Bacteroidaceae bacterium]|nr:ATP-dependent helicase [Bacteroidaceae bacterium]